MIKRACLQRGRLSTMFRLWANTITFFTLCANYVSARVNYGKLGRLMATVLYGANCNTAKFR